MGNNNCSELCGENSARNSETFQQVDNINYNDVPKVFDNVYGRSLNNHTFHLQQKIIVKPIPTVEIKENNNIKTAQIRSHTNSQEFIPNHQEISIEISDVVPVYPGFFQDRPPYLLDKVSEVYFRQGLLDHSTLSRALRAKPYYLSKEGWTYQGEWVDNKINGRGKIYYPDQSFLEAQFIDGLANTSDGLYIYPNGDYYRGAFVNGKRNGKGKLTLENILSYQGDWKDDIPQGYGIQISAEGFQYEGHFENGVKSGKGKYSQPNGIIYQGEFKNNKQDGYGKLTMDNGTVYIGTFKQGRRQGQGEMIYRNGNRSKSKFKDDAPVGQIEYIMDKTKSFKGIAEPENSNRMTILKSQIVR